jgi:hypothetical protein
MISKKWGPNGDEGTRGPSPWPQSLQLLDSARFLSVFSLFIRGIALHLLSRVCAIARPQSGPSRPVPFKMIMKGQHDHRRQRLVS